MKPACDRLFSLARGYDGNGCLTFDGSDACGGYGAFAIKTKRIVTAHRSAWKILNGKIPKGLVVMHTCDNKLCISPSHLRIGTQKENVEDMHKKGRRPETRRMLRAIDVIDMRMLHASGMHAKDIAARYQRTMSHTYAILSRRKWAVT